MLVPVSAPPGCTFLLAAATAGFPPPSGATVRLKRWRPSFLPTAEWPCPVKYFWLFLGRSNALSQPKDDKGLPDGFIRQPFAHLFNYFLPGNHLLKRPVLGLSGTYNLLNLQDSHAVLQALIV